MPGFLQSEHRFCLSYLQSFISGFLVLVTDISFYWNTQRLLWWGWRIDRLFFTGFLHTECSLSVLLLGSQANSELLPLILSACPKSNFSLASMNLDYSSHFWQHLHEIQVWHWLWLIHQWDQRQSSQWHNWEQCWYQRWELVDCYLETSS